MANMLIPVEERHLTPQEVEALDRRRRRGQLFLVICFQCIIVGTLVTLWSGQDLSYSPGWARPMVYWNAILFVLAVIFGIAGIRLRRGSDEFLSYLAGSPKQQLPPYAFVIAFVILTRRVRISVVAFVR